MSDDGDRLVAKAQEKLRSLEAEVVKIKEFINQIREFEGQDPPYTDLANRSETTLGTIRGDQFYGRPLATVVREVLEMRRAANQGPASVNEIYDRLIEGGYKFETTHEHNAKRGLRISLTKNPAFHKLPNGEYGLSEWYPTARSARRSRLPGLSEDAGNTQAAQDEDSANAEPNDIENEGEIAGAE